jgi:ABC-type polysaccharide/polyol phosphate transport system ATPase subunit
MPIIEVKNAGITFRMLNKGRISLKSSIFSKISKRLSKNDKKTEPFHALRDISFEVEKGEVIGITGNNGAGKSTLLRLIAGIYQPDSGSIRVNGSISALLSLGAGFENELSGIDNIYLNALYMGIQGKKIDGLINEIIDFSGLGDFIYQPVKTYSSGMRARLGFSISYFVKCDIMLIDEVLGVGDKDFKAKSNQAILDLIKSGITVLLVSHNINTIQELCGRTIWLEKGKLKKIGDTNLVTNSYKN